VLRVSYPRPGHHTGRRNITVNGTTEPFATVTAGDFVAVAGADGNFSMNVVLLFGNNTLIIKSTDRAGNFNSLTWYIVRDRPSTGRATPWREALLAFVAILAAENGIIYAYYRKRGRKTEPAAPAAETPSGGTIPMGRAIDVQPAPGGPAVPPGGPAGRSPGAPEPPPEALPVREDETAETVDMK